MRANECVAFYDFELFQKACGVVFGSVRMF